MKNNQFLTLSHEYQIDKTQTLGKGSTGEVYLGKSLSSNQPVAIKVIRLQTIDNEVTEYLLKMEKTALQTVFHENVLRGLKIIENASKCYIITEYCNGGTLKQLIKKQGALSESKSLEIIKGILKGYSSLVRNKIVHRDLKPANIMLHSNIPKIIDFGYCEIQGHLKPSLQYNVGSPSYMAPESFQNNIYNQKTQIWAIGVILFQCLMGKTFDDGKHMTEVFKTIKKYGIPFGRQISDKCRKIISWCLEFKPQKRPSALELLQHLSQNKNTQPQFFILEKGRTKINSLFASLNGYQSAQIKRKVPQIEQKVFPVEPKRLGRKISVKCQQKPSSDDMNTKASSSNSKSKQNFGTMTKRTVMMKNVENIQTQVNRQTKNDLVQNQYGLNNQGVYKTQKYFTGQNIHNKLNFHHVSAFSSVMASPRDNQKQQSSWMNSSIKEQRNPESQKQKKIFKPSVYCSPVQQSYNQNLQTSSYRPMIRHQEINLIKNENYKYVSREQPLNLRNSGQCYQQRQIFRQDNGSYSVYESIPVFLNRQRPTSSIYQLNQCLNEKQNPISIFNSVPQKTFR